MKRLLLLMAVVLLILLLPAWLQAEAGYFWSPDNARFLIARTGLLTLGALGMMWVLTVGGIDLSAAAIVTLGSSAGAAWIGSGGGAFGALLIATGAGCGAGMLNGATVALTRISPVLITLAAAGLYTGLAQRLAPALPLTETGLNFWIAPFPKPAFLLLAPVFWLALLLVGLSVIVMRFTAFAIHLLAVGSNERAARLYGVAVGWKQWMAYTLAGGLFGLMGGMLCGVMSSTANQLRMGASGEIPLTPLTLLIELLTAAFIGQALGRTTGRVWGTLLGVFLVALLRNAAQQAGWQPWAQAGIMALLLIAAAAQLPQRRLINGRNDSPQD